MDFEGTLSSLLAFVAGLWASTYLQDRDVRRRHLGLVRALLAEIRRIRMESGALEQEYIPLSVLGAKALLPDLSPWVQTALVELASTSPDVIRGFMDLERYLGNLKTFVSLSERASEELERRKSLKAQAESAFSNATLDDFAGVMVAELQAKRDEENAERGTELARFAQSKSFRHVQSTLQELDGTLTSMERSLAAGFWTHLPWRRAP
jgi:hypothetical protein